MKRIQVKNLSLKLGKKKILDNIHLDIHEGDKIALLGPNGSGKTTLVNVILNLQKFKNGFVQNDFLNLPAYKIGVHLQESNLNGLMKVKEALKLFKFDGDNEILIKKYGLKDKLNQKIVTLSGGEKQKLLLILALQNNPEVLFIDEITTGLDVQSRKSIMSYIENDISLGKKTLVMITHYLEEAETLCDKFAFIKNGSIFEYGSISDLYKKYNIFRKICIEVLSTFDIPNHFHIDSYNHNIIEISIKSDEEMINIMSFINKNNANIKKYDIYNPSLERLYNSIIGDTYYEENS